LYRYNVKHGVKEEKTSDKDKLAGIQSLGLDDADADALTTWVTPLADELTLRGHDINTHVYGLMSVSPEDAKMCDAQRARDASAAAALTLARAGDDLAAIDAAATECAAAAAAGFAIGKPTSAEPAAGLCTSCIQPTRKLKRLVSTFDRGYEV
jgi:hypothetical protein